MIAFEPSLYVRMEQLASGPRPLPLSSGFNDATAYRLLGLYTPSETAEAYLILSNDRDEIWFISNRHVRVVGLNPSSLALRTSLACPRFSRPREERGEDVGIRSVG